MYWLIQPSLNNENFSDESGRLATIAENPFSAQSPQEETSTKAEFDFTQSVLIQESPSQHNDDSILKNNEKESSPADEEIVDEHEAILQDAKDLRAGEVDENIVNEHKDTLKDVEDMRSGEMDTSSEFVDEHQAILQDVDDLRTVATVQSVAVVETSDGDCNTSIEVKEVSYIIMSYHYISFATMT